MSTVQELMAANRERVVQAWFELVLDTYPPETAKLWKKGRDPFQNPVGHHLMRGIEGVYAYLSGPDGEGLPEDVLALLDDMVRVRAVQNFSPSGAVGFIFLLKKALRETLWSDVAKSGAWAGLLAVESRIDGLALAGLDIYAKCRESIHAIKVEELHKHQRLLLRRAQLIVGIGEGEPAD
jgi:hypothetical protein